MVNAAHLRKAIKARVCLWTACSCAFLRRKIQRVQRRGKGLRLLATGEFDAEMASVLKALADFRARVVTKPAVAPATEGSTESGGK